jgi:hypothetical protein
MSYSDYYPDTFLSLAPFLHSLIFLRGARGGRRALLFFAWAAGRAVPAGRETKKNTQKKLKAPSTKKILRIDPLEK